MAKNGKGVSNAEQKRKNSTGNSVGARYTLERALWIGGLVLFLFSVYLFIASVAHLFVWENDVAAVANNPQNADVEVANIGGPMGAFLAHMLIGKSFGLCGLLIPVIGVLFGGFFIMQRSRVLWRTALSIMLITICGSLTLAFLPFGEGLYGSDLGGEFGLAIVNMLDDKIGVIGVILTLVAAWILTGVIINLNFIDFIKRTTINGVEQSKDLLSTAREFVARKREDRKAQKENAAAENDAVEGGDQVRVVGATEEPTVQPQPEPTPVTPEPQPAPEQPTEPEVEPTPEDVVTETENTTDSQSNIDVVEVTEHTDPELSSAQIDKRRPYDPDSTPDYQFPKVECLLSHENGAEVSNEEIEENKQRIEEALGNFGVPIVSMTATIGPTVTLYEIVQEKGVKIAKVKSLESDIAQSLKARGIRIIAPIPGKGTIGIEVPNINKETVSMRSAIKSERFQNFKAELPVVIGRTIQNENFVFDLAKMPHLLVAGATGQGKSVGLNAIITSLLYRKDPSQLKFVLIDPKTVEFKLYEKLENHYLAKMESEDDIIVKDPKKAIYTLNSLCAEMESRLAKCGDAEVRNIVEYNEKVRKHEIDGSLMPYIVVIIDEFADLIQTAKEVEKPVMRLAQKARAIGIHLIVATQRPDVKVITGTIKANFPARIAFRVMQMTDSRTIIDQPGAQQLIGRGDMLISINGELTRVQCAFVDTPEVCDIVNHISQQPYPYPTGTYMLPDFEDGSSGSGGSEPNFGSESGAPRQYDEYFAAVARDAVASGRLSTSSIQSIYNVGFNRAGRITRQLEQAGIVGPANGSKPRDTRIHDMEELEKLLQALGVE
ncbi:MAG: DNA translocase FtsK 4TM domain-containing protein [Alistipes sp.]|nr:DNA translocase FtsK 4TM domain-containing protein [Alistipes sp.]